METLEKTAPVGVRDERISPLGACLYGQKWKDFGCSVVTLEKKNPQAATNSPNAVLKH